jgi:hypothetical protein
MKRTIERVLRPGMKHSGWRRFGPSYRSTLVAAALFGALSAAALVLSASTSSSAAASLGCQVPAGGYRGAPTPFTPPSGGTERDSILASGNRSCTLYYADGQTAARVVQTPAGTILAASYYNGRGQLTMTVSGTPVTIGGGGSGWVTCGSDVRNPLPSTWGGTINWYINYTIPTYLNTTTTISSLRAAHTEWVTNQNWCGYADNSTFNTAYQGQLGAGSYSRDGFNMFGWGDAAAPCGGAGSTIACTICWLNGTFPLECDTVMDNAHFPNDWSNAPNSSQLDVQSVAAHEMGHQAQFDHVNNTTNLMNPVYHWGDTSGQYLGKGDALENNAKY